MTRKEILEGQLARNKGHSAKAHSGKSFEETGFRAGCYRCSIMETIMRIEGGVGKRRFVEKKIKASA